MNMYQILNYSIMYLKKDLKDQYLQQWSSLISETSKLSYYRDYKLAYDHEMYLSCLQVHKLRHAMAKFRACSHDVQRDRHTGISRDEWLSKLCGLNVEDEKNFAVIFSSIQFT